MRYAFSLKALLGAALLAVGCAKDRAPLPRGKMAAVLADVHLAEAWSATAGPDSLRSVTTRRNLDSLALYYRIVLQKHKLSEEQFASALAWYKARPTEMDSVYNRVMPLLQEAEAKSAR